MDGSVDPRGSGEFPGGILSAVFRRFGEAEDLEIDFGSEDRPALLSRIIAGTMVSGGLSAEERMRAVWNLSVSERIGALLEIVRVTEGSEVLPVEPRCPDPSCGRRFEVELNLDDLLAPLRNPRRPERLTFQPEGAEPVQLRRPTGADQRRWRESVYPSTEAAIAALTCTLAVEGVLDEETALRSRDSLAAALAEFDPLTAFHIETVCPHCGSPADLPLDLETLALERLRARQQRAFEEVHLFALHYGWTESEVLAVPRWRRARYLQMILRGREKR